MNKLIKGTEVIDMISAAGENKFCEFFCMVRKGHEECGDSALVYEDQNKVIVAVFDGVSGEQGASKASSDAAEGLLDSLKEHDEVDEEKMKSAIISASQKISFGYTTAVILFLQKNGDFMIAGVGDSPVYSLDSAGKISLELPIGRTVGDDASILKFFYFRNMVTSVLGNTGRDLEINIRAGKLKKGEIFVLATDGLSDNLYVKTHDGYVTESSGTEDLVELIGRVRSPGGIVKALFEEIGKRIKVGRVEMKGRILVPKEDDIAIVVVKRI